MKNETTCRQAEAKKEAVEWCVCVCVSRRANEASSDICNADIDDEHGIKQKDDKSKRQAENRTPSVLRSWHLTIVIIWHWRTWPEPLHQL